MIKTQNNIYKNIYILLIKMILKLLEITNENQRKLLQFQLFKT